MCTYVHSCAAFEQVFEAHALAWATVLRTLWRNFVVFSGIVFVVADKVLILLMNGLD